MIDEPVTHSGWVSTSLDGAEHIGLTHLISEAKRSAVRQGMPEDAPFYIKVSVIELLPDSDDA